MHTKVSSLVIQQSYFQVVEAIIDIVVAFGKFVVATFRAGRMVFDVEMGKHGIAQVCTFT